MSNRLKMANIHAIIGLLITTDISNLIPSTKRDMEKKEEATEELSRINQDAARRNESPALQEEI